MHTTVYQLGKGHKEIPSSRRLGLVQGVGHLELIPYKPLHVIPLEERRYLHQVVPKSNFVYMSKLVTINMCSTQKLGKCLQKINPFCLSEPPCYYPCLIYFYTPIILMLDFVNSFTSHRFFTKMKVKKLPCFGLNKSLYCLTHGLSPTLIPHCLVVGLWFLIGRDVEYELFVIKKRRWD